MRKQPALLSPTRTTFVHALDAVWCFSTRAIGNIIVMNLVKLIKNSFTVFFYCYHIHCTFEGLFQLLLSIFDSCSIFLLSISFRWTSLCAKFWLYSSHRSSVHICIHLRWPPTFVMRSGSHWAYISVTFASDSRQFILSVYQPYATSSFAHKIHKLCSGKWSITTIKFV